MNSPTPRTEITAPGRNTTVPRKEEGPMDHIETVTEDELPEFALLVDVPPAD
ncbi:hypothetical protein [Streptoalloteichus hindustanus]|uniref:Uncharacterized protein n=1 Tax=Streptoalloteichus hindustanus TaxID=2017 RepID=A0A1M5CYI1_STRHI|nr:hypothetical protein [Streptoalloteichus hindustanus]SHF59853.1 hypothetical protein SAMN05444320_104226 [Streptoalloteichus hindustanus]